MKYALLVYETPDAWHGMPSEQRHAAHQSYHAAAALPGTIAHYRLRPDTATTVRVDDDNTVIQAGPLVESRERFRALYLLESDSREAVIELAAGIPAARMGGAVEIWPLTEPPARS